VDSLKFQSGLPCLTLREGGLHPSSTPLDIPHGRPKVGGDPSSDRYAMRGHIVYIWIVEPVRQRGLWACGLGTGPELEVVSSYIPDIHFSCN
jgi:hypothetical protein